MCGGFGDGRGVSDASIGRRSGLVEAVAAEALCWQQKWGNKRVATAVEFAEGADLAQSVALDALAFVRIRDNQRCKIDGVDG